MRFVEKMRTEGQAANAYEEATDGCRRSVLGTQNSARKWQRVKPDPEAELDYEKEPRLKKLGWNHIEDATQ